jgi:hypothetical protein
MSFERAINDWVKADNRVKEYTVILREFRNERNKNQDIILNHISENDALPDTIAITDGQLKFHNNKTTEPLTFKFISQCLTDCISDEEQVAQLIKYIKQKRAIKYVPDVKRTYN